MSREIKTDTYYEQSGNLGIGHVSGGEFKNTKIAGVMNEAEQKNLAEAAREIQELLEQLSKTYTEEEDIASKAVKEIKNHPTLKAKTINALKYGGKEALIAAIDHPIANILMAFIEGWKDAA